VKSRLLLALILAAVLACRVRNEPSTTKSDDLVAELARDTTIIEQSDRAPDTAALGRLLERIGIPFEERLARTDMDCVLTGKQALSSATVSCRIRTGVEPLRLQIVADSSGYQELHVLDGTEIAQRIDLSEFERPDSGARALYAEDLDGDGAREVVMQRFAGATGNTGFTVWRADPAAHRLTGDSAMSAMTGLMRMPGRPCVLEGWNTSVYDHVSLIECYLGKRWQTVWETSAEAIRARKAIARQLKVRVRDTLRLISADTLSVPE